ncbi:POK11 protein, partial [Ardeotis kori]|nr:POK11 protein [Ardeotis kori]
WNYLGWQISDSIIRPIKIEIAIQLRTLNDVQMLMGDLQWVRSIAGISNEDLYPLRPLLKGTDPAIT